MHTAQAETAGNYALALRGRECPGEEGAQAGGDAACPGGPGVVGRWAPPGKCCERPGAPAKGAAGTPSTADSVCGGIPAERPSAHPDPPARDPENRPGGSVLGLSARCSQPLWTSERDPGGPGRWTWQGPGPLQRPETGVHLSGF